MNGQPIAQEIMSKDLVTISSSAKLLDAYALMQKREIRHLLVTNEAGKIFGIISDRDFQRAMEPEIQGAQVDHLNFDFDPIFKVKDFMSWPVRSVSVDQSIRDAAGLMLESKVSALLITSIDGKPRGIITTDDLVKLLIALLENDPEQAKMSIEGWMAEKQHKADYLI